MEIHDLKMERVYPKGGYENIEGRIKNVDILSDNLASITWINTSSRFNVLVNFQYRRNFWVLSGSPLNTPMQLR